MSSRGHVRVERGTKMLAFIIGLVMGAVLGYLFALWEFWTDKKQLRKEGE